jgi:hypothetical protein
MSDAITTTPGSRAVMRPTKTTLFWRTFLPWQFIRFLFINLRMTAMILKSHDTKLTRRP